MRRERLEVREQFFHSILQFDGRGAPRVECSLATLCREHVRALVDAWLCLDGLERELRQFELTRVALLAGFGLNVPTSIPDGRPLHKISLGPPLAGQQANAGEG